MTSLALLIVTSFMLALLLTPVVRNFANKWGWVDLPGEERRMHSTPVPRVGGIAILLAYLIALLVLALVDRLWTDLPNSEFPIVEKLIPAVLIIFGVGILDDLRGLKPWQKFCGQLLAAGMAIWGGVLVDGVARFEFPVYVAIPLTVIWIVGCANAVNLIDGMDGLAAGVGLFATLTMLLAGMLEGNILLTLAVAPLAGALLGFLRFNFNPATVFLGDSGSLTIGFLLGCFGAIWSQKSATVLGITAPLMALAIPLLDTALSIVRRFLNMKPIWEADRGHIHHRLVDRGMTPRKATLVLYAAAGLGAVLSIFQSAAEDSYAGLILILFCVAAWIGVQHLGYVEFDVAGRWFIEGAFRRQLKAQLALELFHKALDEAPTPSAWHEVIYTGAQEFGCVPTRMRLLGYDFVDREEAQPDPGNWQIYIKLPDDDFVCLERQSDRVKSNGIAEFANLVSVILLSKLRRETAQQLRRRPRSVAVGAD